MEVKCIDFYLLILNLELRDGLNRTLGAIIVVVEGDSKNKFLR